MLHSETEAHEIAGWDQRFHAQGQSIIHCRHTEIRLLIRIDRLAPGFGERPSVFAISPFSFDKRLHAQLPDAALIQLLQESVSHAVFHVHEPIIRKQNSIKWEEFKHAQGSIFVVGGKTKIPGDPAILQCPHHVHYAARGERPLHIVHRRDGMQLINIKIIGFQQLKGALQVFFCVGIVPALCFAGKADLFAVRFEGYA